MLGETKEHREYKGASVTQAAWIRSLMASFVKQWEGTGTRIGELFGASASNDTPELPWNRAMQAAVLIFSGNSFKERIKRSSAKCIEQLRDAHELGLLDLDDPAFFGEYSLISSDQGIRGWLFLLNDLCFVAAADLKLAEWTWDDVASSKQGKLAAATDEEFVAKAIKSFSKTPAAEFIHAISEALSSYDWRSSSTPGLTESERLHQGVFRGSSGYREMRRLLLQHVIEQGGGLGKCASVVAKALGLDS